VSGLRPELPPALCRHLARALVYRFRQRLCHLTLKKHKTRQERRKRIPRFLRAIGSLRQSGLAQIVTVRETLHAWKAEIAAMWRFTPNNGTTEGLHTKVEVMQRQAYGFRNFQSYRLRVRGMCC
jgi:transposase